MNPTNPQPTANDRLDEILDTVLSGMDLTESDITVGDLGGSAGWWETSTGAEFGAKKKTEIAAYLHQEQIALLTRLKQGHKQPLKAGNAEVLLNAIDEAINRIKDELA